MKVNECKVGNLVLFDGEQITVTPLDVQAMDRNVADRYADLYTGIPLTEEMVIKLGCQKSSFGVYNLPNTTKYKLWSEVADQTEWSLRHHIIEPYFCECSGELKQYIPTLAQTIIYVHKFQNLAFELGIELTIKE